MIPDTASLLGTIRTVSEATRERVLDGVRRVAEGIAAAHGAPGDFANGKAVVKLASLAA